MDSDEAGLDTVGTPGAQQPAEPFWCRPHNAPQGAPASRRVRRAGRGHHHGSAVATVAANPENRADPAPHACSLHDPELRESRQVCLVWATAVLGGTHGQPQGRGPPRRLQGVWPRDAARGSHAARLDPAPGTAKDPRPWISMTRPQVAPKDQLPSPRGVSGHPQFLSHTWLVTRPHCPRPVSRTDTRPHWPRCPPPSSTLCAHCTCVGPHSRVQPYRRTPARARDSSRLSCVLQSDTILLRTPSGCWLRRTSPPQAAPPGRCPQVLACLHPSYGSPSW